MRTDSWAIPQYMGCILETYGDTRNFRHFFFSGDHIQRLFTDTSGRDPPPIRVFVVVIVIKICSAAGWVGRSRRVGWVHWLIVRVWLEGWTELSRVWVKDNCASSELLGIENLYRAVTLCFYSRINS